MNNKGNKISDELIKNYILKAQKGYERYYGYKKLKHYLFRKYGIIINYKKLYRLCSELKILKKKIRIYKTKKNVAINRKINGSNQLWEIDIKYGYIKYEKRHFMICEIIDIYDKAILQYHIGNTCKAKNITYLIKKAFFNRGCPKGLIIRTDNGSQFKSKLFEQTCSFLNIHHERIPNATPNKVAHIEAFHSILERECLQYCNFWSLQQAYKEIVNFVSYYNSERIHGSLDYLTPMEYYELQKSDAFVKKVVNL